jgi:hypothetical protein
MARRLRSSRRSPQSSVRIPAESQEQDATRLFQPFQRLGHDRTGSGDGHGLGLGLGLGLAIVPWSPLDPGPKADSTSRSASPHYKIRSLPCSYPHNAPPPGDTSGRSTQPSRPVTLRPAKRQRRSVAPRSKRSAMTSAQSLKGSLVAGVVSGNQLAAAMPSAALRLAMIAPPTTTEMNERTKLVLKNLWRSQARSRSSAATITIATTIAVW